MSPRIELAVTCMSAPLQIEGTVAGVGVYYRARHHRWGIDLTGPGIEPAPEAGDHRWGDCSFEEQNSLSFAMGKIFGLPEIRHAIVEADMAEYAEQETAL